MSKVTFKYQRGIPVECKLTGFKGTINSRVQIINGSIQYGVQPRMRKTDSNFIPDAYTLDEANLIAEKKAKEESVEFAFETGDKVKSRISGFEGFITHRMQYQNGCLSYIIEGPMHEGKEVKIKAWEQELALVNKGLNGPEEAPVKRARTGGPHTREPMFSKAI